MKTTRYVLYYRVSDVKQGQSGLGLSAQKTAAGHFLTTHPGEVLGEYTEVETGKSLHKSKLRPELTKAIAHARSANATFIIAKIDRLARNVAFISALIESGLPFKCCDMPEADNFTIHILAALAEREGNMISERTSAALQALKDRGVKLGSARPGHWDGREHLREAGRKKAVEVSRRVREKEMAQRYEPIIPWIRDMREAGATFQGIVDQLNAKGCQTRRGNPWNVATLRRVIAKYLGSDYLGQKTAVLNRCRAMIG